MQRVRRPGREQAEDAASLALAGFLVVLTLAQLRLTRASEAGEKASR